MSWRRRGFLKISARSISRSELMFTGGRGAVAVVVVELFVAGLTAEILVLLPNGAADAGRVLLLLIFVGAAEAATGETASSSRFRLLPPKLLPLKAGLKWFTVG